MTAQPASEKQEKSEKEREKERQKAEKLKKFEAKNAQLQTNGVATAPTKVIEKKKQEGKEQLDSADYVEDTLPGDKKILKPLDDKWHKAYVPKVAGKFVIVIPPPNVTGALVCLLPQFRYAIL